MSTTTIKVDSRQKARFDRLQATLRVLTGRKVTQSELFGRILEKAEASPEDLTDKQWKPLTREERDRLLGHPLDLGFELGDVDEVLYGKKPRSRH
jgi:hypothetical protein